MNYQDITFANKMGEYLAPFLKVVRATGFFEAYVFLPAMTLLSILIFIWLVKITKTNGTFDVSIRSRLKPLFLIGYYTLCFLATNSTAVAFKTLIVQEMDYETPVWFMYLVSPLHFYMTSVAAVYLWLILRNQTQILDRILCLFIQIALVGGYYTAFYRLANEPIEFTDITTGLSGVFFFIWFGFLNFDLILRFFQRN